MKLYVHTLVKNEARYLWFAVNSVINYVDKILLWDTGSTDCTPDICKELRKLYPDKISFKEMGEVDSDEFTQVRQKMLEETKSDWLLILDGDEVWWEDSIRMLRQKLERKTSLDSIVVPYYNIIGDIFHYQKEDAGKYSIDGRVGHITIRAMNLKIPGLHLEKPHGTQGFFDGEGVLVQNRAKNKRIFLNTPYLHFTHMFRSFPEKESDVPKRKMKLKFEIGNTFPLDFYYPEVFFKARPPEVPSPWYTMSTGFAFRSYCETPFRRLKRKLIQSKVGY